MHWLKEKVPVSWSAGSAGRSVSNHSCHSNPAEGRKLTMKVNIIAMLLCQSEKL